MSTPTIQRSLRGYRLHGHRLAFAQAQLELRAERDAKDAPKNPVTSIRTMKYKLRVPTEMQKRLAEVIKHDHEKLYGRMDASAGRGLMDVWLEALRLGGIFSPTAQSLLDAVARLGSDDFNARLQRSPYAADLDSVRVRKFVHQKGVRKKGGNVVALTNVVLGLFRRDVQERYRETARNLATEITQQSGLQQQASIIKKLQLPAKREQKSDRDATFVFHPSIPVLDEGVDPMKLLLQIVGRLTHVREQGATATGGSYEGYRLAVLESGALAFQWGATRDKNSRNGRFIATQLNADLVGLTANSPAFSWFFNEGIRILSQNDGKEFVALHLALVPEWNEHREELGRRVRALRNKVITVLGQPLQRPQLTGGWHEFRSSFGGKLASGTSNAFRQLTAEIFPVIDGNRERLSWLRQHVTFRDNEPEREWMEDLHAIERRVLPKPENPAMFELPPLHELAQLVERYRDLTRLLHESLERYTRFMPDDAAREGAGDAKRARVVFSEEALNWNEEKIPGGGKRKGKRNDAEKREAPLTELVLRKEKLPKVPPRYPSFFGDQQREKWKRFYVAGERYVVLSRFVFNTVLPHLHEQPVDWAQVEREREQQDELPALEQWMRKRLQRLIGLYKRSDKEGIHEALRKILEEYIAPADCALMVEDRKNADGKILKAYVSPYAKRRGTQHAVDLLRPCSAETAGAFLDRVRVLAGEGDALAITGERLRAEQLDRIELLKMYLSMRLSILALEAQPHAQEAARRWAEELRRRHVNDGAAILDDAAQYYERADGFHVDKFLNAGIGSALKGAAQLLTYASVSRVYDLQTENGGQCNLVYASTALTDAQQQELCSKKGEQGAEWLDDERNTKFLVTDEGLKHRMWNVCIDWRDGAMRCAMKEECQPQGKALMLPKRSTDGSYDTKKTLSSKISTPCFQIESSRYQLQFLDALFWSGQRRPYRVGNQGPFLMLEEKQVPMWDSEGRFRQEDPKKEPRYTFWCSVPFTMRLKGAVDDERRWIDGYRHEPRNVLGLDLGEYGVGYAFVRDDGALIAAEFMSGREDQRTRAPRGRKHRNGNSAHPSHVHPRGEVTERLRAIGEGVKRARDKQSQGTLTRRSSHLADLREDTAGAIRNRIHRLAFSWDARIVYEHDVDAFETGRKRIEKLYKTIKQADTERQSEISQRLWGKSGKYSARPSDSLNEAWARFTSRYCRVCGRYAGGDLAQAVSNGSTLVAERTQKGWRALLNGEVVHLFLHNNGPVGEKRNFGNKEKDAIEGAAWAYARPPLEILRKIGAKVGGCLLDDAAVRALRERRGGQPAFRCPYENCASGGAILDADKQAGWNIALKHLLARKIEMSNEWQEKKPKQDRSQENSAAFGEWKSEINVAVNEQFDTFSHEIAQHHGRAACVALAL